MGMQAEVSQLILTRSPHLQMMKDTIHRSRAKMQGRMRIAKQTIIMVDVDAMILVRSLRKVHSKRMTMKSRRI
jgi:hypothetical protein